MGMIVRNGVFWYWCGYKCACKSVRSFWVLLGVRLDINIKVENRKGLISHVKWIRRTHEDEHPETKYAETNPTQSTISNLGMASHSYPISQLPISNAQEVFQPSIRTARNLYP